MNSEPREGSVRVLDTTTNEYRTAEPGSMWFSTLTMAAEEVYLDGRWQPIWSEQDGIQPTHESDRDNPGQGAR